MKLRKALTVKNLQSHQFGYINEVLLFYRSASNFYQIHSLTHMRKHIEYIKY